MSNDAVNNLRAKIDAEAEAVALSATSDDEQIELGRVVVPPHVKVVDGKAVRVKGYTYNRRGQSVPKTPGGREYTKKGVYKGRTPDVPDWTWKGKIAPKGQPITDPGRSSDLGGPLRKGGPEYRKWVESMPERFRRMHENAPAEQQLQAWETEIANRVTRQESSADFDAARGPRVAPPDMSPAAVAARAETNARDRARMREERRPASEVVNLRELSKAVNRLIAPNLLDEPGEGASYDERTEYEEAEILAHNLQLFKDRLNQPGITYGRFMALVREASEDTGIPLDELMAQLGIHPESRAPGPNQGIGGENLLLSRPGGGTSAINALTLKLSQG